MGAGLPTSSLRPGQGPHSGDDTYDLIDHALHQLVERRGAWLGDDLTASLIDQAERFLPELVTSSPGASRSRRSWSLTALGPGAIPGGVTNTRLVLYSRSVSTIDLLLRGSRSPGWSRPPGHTARPCVRGWSSFTGVIEWAFCADYTRMCRVWHRGKGRHLEDKGPQLWRTANFRKE